MGMEADPGTLILPPKRPKWSGKHSASTKRVLGGHMCIMGDVPATLLAFGSKDEVRQYCQRLIREVGGDGGFILGSGCSIPFNARPENVVAMREAVMDAD